MHPPTKLTPEKRNKLNALIEKGISDLVIAKELKLSVHFVGKTSTKYWKDKMKEKDE